MKSILAFCLLAPLAGWADNPVAPAPVPSAPAAKSAYKPAAGPAKVKVVDETWTDAARKREIPVRLYVPSSEGKRPVVVFSHGLGGSREAAPYLGQCWASHGYLCVFLQHPGSDTAVWKDKAAGERMEAMVGAKNSLTNALERTGDVRFAIDRLFELDAKDGSDLKGKVDHDHIAMAGHSFGAWTTLAVSGLSLPLPGGRQLNRPDPRIKAAIPLSSPGPRQPGNREANQTAYSSIKIPTFLMTGTLDTTAITPDTKPSDREIPFEFAPPGGKFLVVLEGGDHMVFNGGDRVLRNGDPKRDPLLHGLIEQGTLAFLDGYLLERPEAVKWLKEGGYAAFCGADAKVRMK